MVCRCFERGCALHVRKTQTLGEWLHPTISLPAKHICYDAGSSGGAIAEGSLLVDETLVFPLPITYPRGLVKVSYGVPSRAAWRYLHHQELVSPRRPYRTAAVPRSTSPYVSQGLSLRRRRAARDVPLTLLRRLSCRASPLDCCPLSTTQS